MIRNVDINFFKNQKIKLCAIGVGIMIGMGLTGCTNINNQDLNTNTPSSAEEIIEESEKSTIILDYQGTEALGEDRDVIAFTELDKKEVMGIATSDSDDNDLNIPAGNYVILSEHLGSKEVQIEEGLDYTVTANYTTNELSITQNVDEKAPTR